MIKVENIEVFNFEGAIRGMRNPLQSHDKSDSYMCDEKHCNGRCCDDDMVGEKDCTQPDGYHIGKNDLNLMRRLYKAGTEHRKYLRQIFVSMDIVAPDYFFKEFSTYKVGTVENSTSTMHRIAAKRFELDDFSHEHLKEDSYQILNNVCEILNDWRYIYLNGSAWCEKYDKEVWWQLIQLLPMSYNYRRTVTMNYENVVTMLRQRSDHKLDEWRIFCDILRELPYIKEITSE